MASLKDKLMAANEAGMYTDEEARQRALDARSEKCNILIVV